MKKVKQPDPFKSHIRFETWDKLCEYVLQNHRTVHPYIGNEYTKNYMEEITADQIWKRYDMTLNDGAKTVVTVVRVNTPMSWCYYYYEDYRGAENRKMLVVKKDGKTVFVKYCTKEQYEKYSKKYNVR